MQYQQHHPCERTAVTDNLSRHFPGKKEKWLPLYRRVIARLTSRIAGLEILPEKSYLSVSGFGVIWVGLEGLELGLSLSRAHFKSPRLKESRRSPRRITHRVLISAVADVDDELLTWIRMARLQVRIAKSRST